MPCDVALSVCDANAQHRSKSSKECRHSNGTEWLDASAEDDARRRARNASGRVVAQGQPLGSCKLIKLPASEAAALKLPQTCFVTAMHIFGEGSPPTAQWQKAAVSIVEFNIGNPRYFTVKLNPNLGFVGREADDADYCFVAPSAEDVGNLPDPCPFEDAETRVRQAGVCFSIFQFPQQQPGMVTTPFSPITICDQFIDHMGQTYLGSSGATYDVQPTYQPVAIHVSGGQGDGDLNRGYKISTALIDAMQQSMQQHAQYAGAAADSDFGAAAMLPSGAAMTPPVGALVPFQPPPPELGFPVKRRRVFGIPWCEACHTDRRWPVNLRVNTRKYGMVDLTLVTPDHPFLKKTPEVRCAIYSCIHTGPGNGVRFKHEWFDLTLADCATRIQNALNNHLKGCWPTTAAVEAAHDDIAVAD